MKPYSLLDCTLRDGGYVNGWDAPTEQVVGLLRACWSAGVQTVEVGFVNGPGPESEDNPWLNTTAPMLREVIAAAVPSCPAVAVMVDWKCFNFSSVLNTCREGGVSLLRVATPPETFLDAARACSLIRSEGIAVSLNLMRMSTISLTDLRLIGRTITTTRPNVLTLADSYGACRPADVAAAFAALRESVGPDQPLGFHAHDTLNLALINAWAAVKAGAVLIDSTVGGVGRGGGNLATELIVGADRGPAKADPLLAWREQWMGIPTDQYRHARRALANRHPTADLSHPYFPPESPRGPARDD